MSALFILRFRLEPTGIYGEYITDASLQFGPQPAVRALIQRQLRQLRRRRRRRRR
jgi:hypothetical protein